MIKRILGGLGCGMGCFLAILLGITLCFMWAAFVGFLSSWLVSVLIPGSNQTIWLGQPLPHTIGILVGIFCLLTGIGFGGKAANAKEF